MVEQRIKCKSKCYVKPMKDPLGLSPSNGNQGTTRSKEKILLTLVGIEPTTSGLDLPLFCRLSYEVGQRKSGMMVNRGEEKVRVHMNVVPRSTMKHKSSPTGFDSHKGQKNFFLYLVWFPDSLY